MPAVRTTEWTWTDEDGAVVGRPPSHLLRELRGAGLALLAFAGFIAAFGTWASLSIPADKAPWKQAWSLPAMFAAFAACSLAFGLWVRRRAHDSLVRLEAGHIRVVAAARLDRVVAATGVTCEVTPVGRHGREEGRLANVVVHTPGGDVALAVRAPAQRARELAGRAAAALGVSVREAQSPLAGPVAVSRRGDRLLHGTLRTLRLGVPIR